MRKGAIDKYQVTEDVTKYCCYTPVQVNLKHNDDDQDRYKRMLNRLPNSAVALHAMDCISDEVETEFLEDHVDEQIKCILQSEGHYMEELCKFEIDTPQSCCRKFYTEKIVCLNRLELCEKIRKDDWLQVRKYRITGEL